MFTPFDHQVVTTEFLTMHRRAFCLNDMGCVDSETEYLGPTGWKKISEYAGGKVTQYDPETGEAELVTPTEYVKLPCDMMVRVKTKYGVDQLLSLEHRVLVQSRSNPGKREVVQAAELLRRHDNWLVGAGDGKSASRVSYSETAIPVTFTHPGGSGLLLTDAQLRVQVAVIADGYFPPNETNLCVVRLKKQRKKDRLRALLLRAGIEHKERELNTTTAQGFTVFSFVAPMKVKHFGSAFWEATGEQLCLIADEVLYWDSTIGKGRRGDRFSTYVKESADFVQYAMVATGRTARLAVNTRTRRGAEETEYVVAARNGGKALQLKSLGSDGTKHGVMHLEPSTDGFKYCFVVPSTFLVLRRNGCVFCTGNTGKTLSVLWAYDYLRREQMANKMIVVSPLSTLERTWGDEIFKNFPHLTFAVLHGTRGRRLKLLEEDVDIYLVNHDGAKILQKEVFARADVDMIVVDEIAQAARNAGTDRWRALKGMTVGKQWVWGLTGTPTPNDPTDAWAQCRLIVPENVPPYFGKFRDTVMKQVGTYKWVSRPDALNVVHEAMQPAIRYKRDECIDLPDCVYETRTAEMTPDQNRMYKDMLTRLHAELDGNQVTAVNEAVKAMKLVQIACGVVYDNDGKTVAVPAHGRLAATLGIIEEAPAKVIVFVPFTSALRAVEKFLVKNAITVEVIDGSVSKAERDRIIGAFQNTAEPRVLVAQPAAMSHGLTLTAANTIIWFAPINSNETYEQANARITRPGQKNTQLIVHIEGSPIERKIYERLQHKGKMQGLLLETFSDRV
jgi:superfamily II DNA or RNA helicase